MKRIFTIFTLLFLLSVSAGTVNGLFAQDGKAVMSGITSSIQRGDASGLSNHFNSNVELVLPGVDQRYAKNQAQFVVKDFFTKNSPKGYSVSHQGNSGSNYYAVGTYSSSGGQFETNVLLKNVSGKLLITELRFEGK